MKPRSVGPLRYEYENGNIALLHSRAGKTVDVLLVLSRIKMYRTEKGEIMSEIPKKVKDLVNYLKIDLGMLYKEA